MSLWLLSPKDLKWTVILNQAMKLPQLMPRALFSTVLRGSSAEKNELGRPPIEL